MWLLVIPALSVSIGHMILFSSFLLGYFAHLQLSACMVICTHISHFPLGSLHIMLGQYQCYGPSHLPRTHLSLGYVTALSLKYMQSYQPNSHKCLMLAVSPFMTVLGTSPSSSKTLFAVHDHISISNPKQSSHSFIGELDLIIFLPAPFFSSLIVLSAAFCHGE